MLTFLDQQVKKEKTTLIRVKVNDQGYTSSGHYFGTGKPLYWYAIPLDGKYVESYIRADSREQAKAFIRAKHPKRRIEFYI